MDINPLFITSTKGFTGKTHTQETRDRISRSKRNKPNLKLQKLSQKEKDEIVLAKNTGSSVRELAEKFGVSTSTIYRVIKESS